MISPDARLFSRLEQMPGSEQEQQRLRTLEELGLLEPESVPILEEATQTAAHFLDAPICVLGLLDRDRVWFKSAVGLSRIGLMNELASSRQLPRHDSLWAHALGNPQVIAIADATTNPISADSLLVHRYGIRSYLGVPILSSNGQCLGILAVMGLMPREFTSKDADILQLIARWSMSEFERDRVLKHPQTITPSQSAPLQPAEAVYPPLIPSIKARLISQMAQELWTPLTSILGMARVLSQGIYGSLTEKQKEYIEIIHNSGQHLSSIINEVMELGALDDCNLCITLNPIDVEMLCQQAINTLIQSAQRHNQQIQLTIEPGPRIWLLDKDKVRQMLYHLVFSVMQSSNPESIIRIHISRKQNFLNLTVWTSHPWLGDGLPQAELTSLVSNPFSIAGIVSETYSMSRTWRSNELDEYESPTKQSTPSDTLTSPEEKVSRQSLGLLLSRQLAELHGGCIAVQGSPEEGYRYVIKLPQLRDGEDKE